MKTPFPKAERPARPAETGFLARLRSRRADGYLDTVLSVMVLCFVLVFILSAVSLVLQYARLQQAADRICESACEKGGTDLGDYLQTVAADVGLVFATDFSGSVFLDEAAGKIQLGDAVRVTLTAEVRFLGFGDFARTVTLSARANGLSRVYWK